MLPPSSCYLLHVTTFCLLPTSACYLFLCVTTFCVLPSQPFCLVLCSMLLRLSISVSGSLLCSMCCWSCSILSVCSVLCVVEVAPYSVVYCSVLCVVEVAPYSVPVVYCSVLCVVEVAPYSVSMVYCSVLCVVEVAPYSVSMVYCSVLCVVEVAPYSVSMVYCSVLQGERQRRFCSTSGSKAGSRRVRRPKPLSMPRFSEFLIDCLCFFCVFFWFLNCGMKTFYCRAFPHSFTKTQIKDFQVLSPVFEWKHHNLFSSPSAKLHGLLAVISTPQNCPKITFMADRGWEWNSGNELNLHQNRFHQTKMHFLLPVIFLCS